MKNIVTDEWSCEWKLEDLIAELAELSNPRLRAASMAAEAVPKGPETQEGLSLAEVQQKIAAQVQYYFSDENLRTDAFLQGLMAKYDGEWIPFKVKNPDYDTYTSRVTSSPPGLAHIPQAPTTRTKGM